MIDDVLGVRGVLRSVLHAIYGRSSLHLHTGVVRYVRGEGHLRAPGLRGGIGVRPRSRPLSLDRRRTVACRFPEHGSRHAGPPRDSPSASTRLWGKPCLLLAIPACGSRLARAGHPARGGGRAGLPVDVGQNRRSAHCRICHEPRPERGRRWHSGCWARSSRPTSRWRPSSAWPAGR